jgi:hypothetical protein
VLESALLSSIGPVIDSLAAAPNVESVVPAIKEEIASIRTLMENTRLKELNIKRKEKRLYQELVKAVYEHSGFAPELISQAYGFVKQELQDASEAYGKYKASWGAATEKLQHIDTINVENWMDVFDYSSIESKKILLEELIERITINNRYELKIWLKNNEVVQQ